MTTVKRILSRTNRSLLGVILISVAIHANAVTLIAKRDSNGVLPSGYRFLTFLLYDGAWVKSVTLPKTARDGDTIVIKSSATWSSKILPNNTIYSTSISLKTGNEYQFNYIGDQQKWRLDGASAKNKYQAWELDSGIIPSLTSQETTVNFADGNWVRDLYLPTPSPENFRVVVDSKATWSFTVRGLKNYYQSKTIRTGDRVTFIVNSSGAWEELTHIDMLMLYSDKLANRIGETAARARAYESFNLTNDALENSGANFRLRLVGLRKVAAKNHWTHIYDPLRELRNDETVQGWRNQLKADALYYEGTESGCGLGWLNVITSSYNMIGTGSINCGTNVMRHEFGHNMGLMHGGNGTDGQYWRGYNTVRSIMGGNRIPYYSTPLRYTADGTRMGIPGRIDAVRRINEVSKTISNYR